MRKIVVALCSSAPAILWINAAGGLQTAMPPSISPGQLSPYSLRHPNPGQFANDYNTKVLLNGESRGAATYRTASDVADCIARTSRGKAGQLIGGPMTDDERFKRLTGALNGRYAMCYARAEGGPELPLYVLNGAIAEALLRLEARPLDERAAAVDMHVAQRFYASASGVTMDSLGRCLAVFSPGLAARLFRNGAGTAGERQALGELLSRTPECGVSTPPGGIPIEEQRSAIATGLYRWLHR